MKHTFKSAAILMAILSMAACQKETFKEVPAQGSTNTFVCSLESTKAVGIDGVQTFKEGDVIDLLDNSTCTVYPVTIKGEMISNNGKTVAFTSSFPNDKSVLAVYPGGYTAKSAWNIKDDGSHDTVPHFACMNNKKDGFATAVAGVATEGTGRTLKFTNVVSCVSFSSSVTAKGDVKWASLWGNDGEKIPSQLVINPETGAATAYSAGIMDYAFSNLAADNPTDIRLWMLPGQEFKKGITLRLGTNATVAKTTLSRVIDTPFSIKANQFIRLGDIDKASEKKKTIEIATAQEFIKQVIQTPHTTTASRDTTYSITADLDFTGMKIVYSNPKEGEYKYASGSYYANINGNGKKIKNLVSSAPLIQKFSAVAQNIVFDESCTCNLSDHSGGILFEANFGGIVKNITSYATVNIVYEGTSTDSVHHGCIMGINRAYVFDCKNYGPVNATLNMIRQDRIGGIIGTVAASPDSESLVPAETLVKGCENLGEITVTITANNNKQLFVGGAFGVMDCGQDCIVSNVKNSGKITINTFGGNNVPYAGGLIGMKKAPNGSVTDCVNTGDVAINGGFNTTKGSVGGILGYRLKGTAGSFATFDNCTVDCTVSCDDPSLIGMVLGKGDAVGSGETFTFGSEKAPIKVAGAVKSGETTTQITKDNLAANVAGSVMATKDYTFHATLLPAAE